MSEYEVKNALRKRLRDIKNPLGNDFLKYLAEILLNSDDSYKRLEKFEDEPSPKAIDIYLDREKQEVEVIDRAEGMSEEELKDKFTEYGASHANGETFQVRGLFGQGASDVLFSSAVDHKKAEIKSIKDDKFQTCRFKFGEDRSIEIKAPKTRLKSIRKSYGIPNNGTIVLFGLPGDVTIPSKRKIRHQIETFYMFRYILSNSNRIIRLHDDGTTYTLSSKKYLMDKKKYLLKDEPIEFEYEDHTIHGVLNLYENPDKKKDRTHVIIKDERDAVYDNTLFGLEKYPGAQTVSGVLEIKGIYSILEEKLNDPVRPLQILTDSRDGFDKRNLFTKTMENTLDPIIKKTIKQKEEAKKNRSLNLDANPEFKKALRRINDYLRDRSITNIGALSPGKEPPSTGIAFAREKLHITEDKTYSLQIFINAFKVKDSSTIKIEYADNAHFELSPQTMTFTSDDANENGLVVKSLHLKGKKASEGYESIRVNVDGFEDETFVQVVKQEMVYPAYGLEFIPKYHTFPASSKTHYLKLYYDLQKFSLEDTVHIVFDTHDELVAPALTMTLSEGKTYEEDGMAFGVLQVPFISNNEGAHYIARATIGESEAECRIKITKKTKNDQGKSGFLSNIKLLFVDDFWQSSFDETEGVIRVNGSHPINIANLGDLEGKDANRPKFTQNQQKYLFELIALESAKNLIKHNKGDMTISDLDSVIDEIQEEKTVIYQVMQEVF